MDKVQSKSLIIFHHNVKAEQPLALLAWHREWLAKSHVNVIGEVARLSRLGECRFNTFRTLHLINGAICKKKT